MIVRAFRVALLVLILILVPVAFQLRAPDGGIDPHWIWFTLAALVAAGFCAAATLSTVRLDAGATKTWATLVWFGLAVLSLLLLDFAGLASRFVG